MTGSGAELSADRADVVIIGAGVVGTAIARTLGHYDLRCVLIEAGNDVGTGTSKANTAILHTGFDAVPGSLESRLVSRGAALLRSYAERAGIPVERTGALLIAWTAEQEAELPGISAKARLNGYTAIRPMTAAELYQREPHLGPGALAALEIPDESIVCPWTTPLAFATEAVRAGVRLLLRTRVTGVRCADGEHEVRTTKGSVRCRWLVNAAGLASDHIDQMVADANPGAYAYPEAHANPHANPEAHANPDADADASPDGGGRGRRSGGGFTIRPRRGELIVFDKLARPLIRSILLPVPTAQTKGVLVAPTVYGNVLLGPTAQEVPDRSDTATTAAGLAALLAAGQRILPDLVGEEVTATYAGLRAATEHRDYQISVDGQRRYACVAGIRSTGLTASLGIAEHVLQQLAAAGLPLRERASAGPPIMPYIGQARTRPYQDAARISADPAYGQIICHCERTTYGEIRDALASTIPPADTDGLRRRTRALNGRCQGFYCAATVSRLLAAARPETEPVPAPSGPTPAPGGGPASVPRSGAASVPGGGPATPTVPRGGPATPTDGPT